MSRDGFLSREAMKDDVRSGGKNPVESERLRMQRIVGAIVDGMFLRSEVDIGSRSQ